MSVQRYGLFHVSRLGTWLIRDPEAIPAIFDLGCCRRVGIGIALRHYEMPELLKQWISWGLVNTFGGKFELKGLKQGAQRASRFTSLPHNK
jgi:hypothetical protein